MGTIYATDRDGSEHELQGREHASFMQILKMAGLSLEALCSGCCQCATCHLYVDPDWLGKLPAATEMETVTLEGEAEEEHIKPNSRVGCQVQWQDDYDGIRVTVAPES